MLSVAFSSNYGSIEQVWTKIHFRLTVLARNTDSQRFPAGLSLPKQPSIISKIATFLSSVVVFSISSVAFNDQNAKTINTKYVSLTQKNPEGKSFPEHGENSFPAGQLNVPFWSFLFVSECTQLRNQSHIKLKERKVFLHVPIKEDQELGGHSSSQRNRHRKCLSTVSFHGVMWSAINFRSDFVL